MITQPKNGTRQDLSNKEVIYYDGYWIRYYPVPEDTLDARKELIDHLTRRAFHHTESGINTPGERLEEARKAYEEELDPRKKRVNGAMLAGAMFNRATDIFTTIVKLEHKGVKVGRDNELMKQCSACFRAALELGKQVRHYSGQEGIDELWGEPFKAFTQPISQVFESRYRKLAQAMRSIDRIADCLIDALEKEPAFEGITNAIVEFAASSKLQIETMKNDKAFFNVWPAFVAARESLEGFPTHRESPGDSRLTQRIDEGVKLIKAGAALITYLAEARVPMLKSSEAFFEQCNNFEKEKDD